MDLDKLKTCAEALGYDCFEVKDGRKSVAVHIYTEPEQDMYRGKEFRKSTQYDPEHNDAQAFELENILIEMDLCIRKSLESGEYLIVDIFDSIIARGNTRKEAAINAVVEVNK